MAGLKVRKEATIKVPLCLYRRRETSYVGAMGEVQFFLLFVNLMKVLESFPEKNYMYIKIYLF